MYPSFDDWWLLYSKKQDRKDCEKKWLRLSQKEKEDIMRHTADYVKSTPDVKYRRNPSTYLNKESWKNEIINPNTNQNEYTKQIQQHGLSLGLSVLGIENHNGGDNNSLRLGNDTTTG